MTYNISQLQAADSIADIFVYANTATGTILLNLFVMAVFFVLLFRLMGHGFAKALASSGFACFIIAAALAYGGFIPILLPLFFLALTAFSGLYLYLT